MVIWKDIKGYEGLYQISNFGNVKSLSRKYQPKEIILAINRLRSGYKAITLWKNNQCTVIDIHRLVATAFIKNLLNKPCVNHLNGIKKDNRVGNLEWCTYKENTQHAFRTGLINMSGSNHYNAKLSEQDVNEIRFYKGILTQKVLAQCYKCSIQNISLIQNNKTWTKQEVK
jgi:hypothetical protein